MNQKIDIGQIVNRVFQIYGDQAGVLLPVALAIFVAEGVISGILILISPVLILVALIVQIVASTLYQGMVVQLVADVQDGRRDSSVGDLFRSVTGVVAPLIGAGILAGLGIALGLVLLIVPGLFLLTIWSVIAPVIVLERTPALAAFGRSRELVRGNGWQVFGTIVLFFLILVVVSAILGGIGAALGDAGRIIMDIISSTLIAPLIALAAGVIYFSLRAAKGEAGPPPGAIGVQPHTVAEPAQPPGQPVDPAAPDAPPPGTQPPGGPPSGPSTPPQGPPPAG
jgi:hypothetical protein